MSAQSAPTLLALADHLPDVIGRVDREHRYLFINRVIEGITGKSVAEYLGRTDDELGYPPALCRLWHEQYQEVFETGRPSEIEFSFQSPQGQLHFNKRAVPELAADGSVEAVVFAARDITTLKLAAAERASHHRVLAGINRIFGSVVVGEDEAAHAAVCLAVAEDLTGSAWAWIGEVGNDGLLHEVAGSGPALGAGGDGEGRDGAPAADSVLGEAIREQVLERGESLVRNAVDASAGNLSAPAGEAGLSAFLGVPLKRRGRVIGMLAVGNRDGGYGPLQQSMLEAFAPAVAEAMTLCRTETKLRQSDERMRVLVEATAQAVWEANAEGRVVVDSPSWRAYTGQSLEELLGDGWIDAIHPEDRAGAERQWCDAVATGRNLDGEYRLRGPGGGWRWTNVRAAPIRDGQGRTVKWVGMNVDITARKDAEAALHNARQQAELERGRLQAVLEATPLAVVLFDADERRFVYQNRRALDLNGADYAGRDLKTHAGMRRILRPDGTPYPIEEWPATLSLEAGRVIHQQEMVMERADGVMLPVLVSSAPVRDSSGRVTAAVVVFDDISERKAAAAALEDLNRALCARVDEVSRQADQLRALANQLTRVEQRERERLARILHDHLQQLIVAAQIQSASMLRDADPERLRASADAVQEALQEALNVSRSLTVELSPPVLRETGLIRALEWLAGRMREQHGLEVGLRADPRAEPDNAELGFLLFECARELLLNVAKHAGVVSADLALRRPRAGELELIAADQGCGFDPQVVSKRALDDTSFGLFSIQERLAHLGGRMTIESAPGRGARVTLAVSVATERAGSDAAASAESTTPGRVLEVRSMPQTRRVLIVDDHAIMREGLAGLFQFEADIDIVGEASNGEEAIALAAELRPDAVVMDVNLGEGIDGIEATRRIVAADPSARVIGLSMHVDEAVARAMREAGAAAYLSKGGPWEQLLAAIRGDAGA